MNAGTGLNKEDIRKRLLGHFGERRWNKVLLIPPDFTRMHSGAGIITQMLYEMLGCDVDIMPALGTHEPMDGQQWAAFFGEIPFEKMLVHDWRRDVVKIGEVPEEFVRRVSDGIADNAIDVEVNRRLLDESYDHIISIGQVVPHEVAGMANYSKNIFVGCGGYSMINRTHSLGAFYGMERILGKTDSPVRKVFDYAEENFIKDLPLTYILTVTDAGCIHDIFIGRQRALFERAAALSREKNITWLDRAPQKIVVYLDGREYKSTWLGNKAVYRTCMAIAGGGDLIVIAPGIRKFGEDDGADKLIRKYGYAGQRSVLKLAEESEDLRNNLSVAAHLIHGSSDGRFKITYAAPMMSKEEIENVRYNYADYDETVKKYNPQELTDGWNTVDGEEIYYISNPALGLWCKR